MQFFCTGTWLVRFIPSFKSGTDPISLPSFENDSLSSLKSLNANCFSSAKSPERSI